MTLTMSHKRLIFILALIAIVIDNTFGIQWLALHVAGNSSVCQTGRNHKWLTKTQSYICVELYPQLVDAAELTVLSCQDMFKHRRWNCSSINFAPNYTPDLRTGTREQAIVYTISSAALVYSLTRSCAQGNIYRCPCHGKPQVTTAPRQLQSGSSLQSDREFKWRGCNDNIRWALKMSRNFLDSPYRKLLKNIKFGSGQSRFSTNEKVISFMNRHNNRIGRKDMERSLSINCQCHGISGSCSMRTCWRGLPNYLINDAFIHRLMTMYKAAVEIFPDEYEVTDFKQFREKLIYVKKSPDYCTEDLRTGSQGTVGRYCNESSQSQNSCNNICCGRGYRSVLVKQEERCRCKYYWCCYVKCKTCSVMLKINQCL